MAAIVKWIDRRFSFDFPVGHYPEIIARLRGTPARVEDLVRPIPEKLRTTRVGEGWSVQEHVGHLVDLEALFMERLDDYAAGSMTLRAADMTNRRTEEARHNEKPIEEILRALRGERARLVSQLEALEPSRFGRVAVHPRLELPMRLVDLMYFQAEHDDYHIARMGELIRR